MVVSNCFKYKIVGCYLYRCEGEKITNEIDLTGATFQSGRKCIEICQRNGKTYSLPNEAGECLTIEGENFDCDSNLIDKLIEVRNNCVQTVSVEPPEPSVNKTPLGPPFQVISIEDESKEPECFWVQTWMLDEGVCYAFVGEDPNENTINLNLYKSFEMNAGTYIRPDLAAKTTVKGFGVCLEPSASIDTAGLLTQAIAQGVVLPNGDDPTGLLNPSVMLNQIGQIGYDTKGAPKKSGVQYVDWDGSAVNASQTICPKEGPLLDEDCDGFLAGYPDTTITNPSTTEQAYFWFCATWICLDPDDSDNTVLGA